MLDKFIAYPIFIFFVSIFNILYYYDELKIFEQNFNIMLSIHYILCQIKLEFLAEIKYCLNFVSEFGVSKV